MKTDEGADQPDQVKVLSEFINGTFSLRLLDDSGYLMSIWNSFSGDDEVPVLELKGADLLDAAMEQLNRIAVGREISDDLHYQQFSSWDQRVFSDLEQQNISIGLIREGRDINVRITAGGSRYELQYLPHPRKDPTSSYMISRLNSVSYGNTVDLLGIGYWSIKGMNLPWMEVVRYPDNVGSGFSPYLADLNSLLEKGIKMDTDRLKKLLLLMSREKEDVTLDPSRRIGRALGEMHGSILLDRAVRTKRRMTEGERILSLFARSKMRMEDVGDLLGRISGYLNAVKKGLYRSIGEMDVPVPMSGRKQKVVRRSGKERTGPLSGLSLLRGALVQKQDRIRERFSKLRHFKGSPMVPCGLDAGLDRIGIGDDGPIFKRFDWSFYDIEEDPPIKTLPLKDLSMVLSSLMKARYLGSRRIFSSIAGNHHQLDLMFLDYNLARDGYLSMLPDVSALSLAKRKDVPFRYVVICSIISSLWYERNRNSLILGYNEGVSNSSNEDLLIYPKGVDTLEGIKMMQVLLSLSSASRSFDEPKFSLVAVESDLLTALSV